MLNAIILFLLPKTEILDRERERGRYAICIETEISLPFMIKVLFYTTYSRFVEMILCSQLTGNITSNVRIQYEEFIPFLQ